MTRYETFAIECPEAGVALVRIDREEKRNAMSVAFFRELPLVLQELDDDDGIRAVVLTGSGQDAFSAGGDIVSFQELTSVAASRRRLRLVYDAFHAVERASKPVIAAVNGVAYGGGTELVLACDLAVASDRARFAFREPTVGLMPGYGVIRGPERIGPAWTRYLALTADPVDAAMAERIGLVQQVVPHEHLLATALDLAGRVASRAPLAVQLGKAFINRTQGPPGQAESIEATALLFATEDHREGVRAFIEKREPRFEGR